MLGINLYIVRADNTSALSNFWCSFECSDVVQNKYNYDSMFGNQPTTRRMYKIILPIE